MRKVTYVITCWLFHTTSMKYIRLIPHRKIWRALYSTLVLHVQTQIFPGLHKRDRNTKKIRSNYMITLRNGL